MSRAFIFAASTMLMSLLADAQPSLGPGASLDDVVAYMCPIHSDYTAEVEGVCPRDGMTLVPSTPFDIRDYELDFQTVPAVPTVGETLTLQFTVSHPGTGETVR